MRRLAGVGLALVVAAAVLVAVGASGDTAGGYRVDALFDNADFLVKGQEVKIAGAVAGSVTGVRVTPQHKARVEMSVETGFAPFRSDASCAIRPESLIGEKFVDCDPGSPQGHRLVGQHGQAPTVPLTHNTSPVDVDLVLGALRLPYRQRLSLLVNELGTGLAGRPAELNAAIRRANPALGQVNRVLAIVNRDRATLGRMVDASDTVLAELARRRGQVADFVDRASRVSQTVASSRGNLGEAIRRLPPALAQLQPASQQLAGLATDARPVVRQLRVAAPSVNAVVGDLPALNDATLPTLGKLDELATVGRRAVRHAEPVAAALRPVANRLPELSLLARQLNENLQQRGVVEGLLTFVYLGSAATARFDRFSHILPSYQIAGTCQQYASTPAAGCSAHWGGGAAPGQPAASAAAKRAGVAGRGSRVAGKSSRHHGRGRSARARNAQPAAAPPPATPPPATPSATPAAPVQQLLNYLLSP